eukprot:UN11611
MWIRSLRLVRSIYFNFQIMACQLTIQQIIFDNGEVIYKLNDEVYTRTCVAYSDEPFNGCDIDTYVCSNGSQYGDAEDIDR